MRAITGAITMTPIACGKVASPDSNGLIPRSSCRISGNRKRVEANPMKATLCVRFASANIRFRNSRTSMSGSSVRSSTSTKIASSASPAPPNPSTTASPKPRSPASARPYRNTASPPEASMSPGMSMRPGLSSRCSRRNATASTMPMTPTGMFTRKIHGHER